MPCRAKGRPEVVIVGFTEPTGTRTGFGALLVGVHDEKGELRFAGKVGTGFTTRSLADLGTTLVEIEVRKPQVIGAPRGTNATGVHWVTPKLVAEVSFTEWTRDGRLRHPSFKGLRTDKPAAEIVRERPAAAPRDAGPSASDTRVVERPARRRIATVRSPTARIASSPVVAGITLSNPGRVLYPEQGVTKLELAHYYESIADWILPHVSGRPLTLVRCPQGQGKQCFFQKHVTDSTPEHIRPVSVVEGSGTGEEPAQYMQIDTVEGLVALVQMGVLELHVWGSRSEDQEHPDRLIFDPDPTVAWPRVVEGALEVRARLSDLGLVSLVKTTGGKGLHVVVPVSGRLTWTDAKAFTRALADAMVTDSPDRYTANMSKARRIGRIFIDYLRNGRGATAIAPYSTRAREGAPVALPLAWSDRTPKLRPGAFHVRNVPARLARLPASSVFRGGRCLRRRTPRRRPVAHLMALATVWPGSDRTPRRPSAGGSP